MQNIILNTPNLTVQEHQVNDLILKNEVSDTNEMGKFSISGVLLGMLLNIYEK